MIVWRETIKPSKRKVVLSAFFFIFPLVQVLGVLETRYLFLPIELGILLEVPLTFVVLIETYIAVPFELLLKPLGWWSNNAPIPFPDGPLLPGSFVVAITYSIFVYVALSFLSAAWKKRRES